MQQEQSSRGYQPPDPIPVPPIYAWPVKPLAAVKYLLVDMLMPWGYLFIALAVFAWHFLTPGMQTMAAIEPGWVALIWLRNAMLLTLVAGGLHWWLYIRKGQDMAFKFNARWPARNSEKFLWRDQVKDNMFWSIVSGVTVWSIYEAVTLWMYASGRMPYLAVSDHPVYFTAAVWGVFFWSTFHFYLNHRALHWPPLYKVAHELHHRNLNTNPWTGISMHPVEHVIYFSVFILWWFVPVHPIVILLTGFFQGISPAVSHSGFDRVKLSGNSNITAGDQFHHLHHKLFNLNYGNVTTPMDRVFGSWHDGTPESMAAMRTRLRELKAHQA